MVSPLDIGLWTVFRVTVHWSLATAFEVCRAGEVGQGLVNCPAAAEGSRLHGMEVLSR